VSAAEGALETTKVRLFKTLGVCLAPQYVAEGLLRAEGFTDVEYVDSTTMNIAGAIATGEYDFGLDFVSDHIFALDRGSALTLLAGVHVGCYELFAREGIRSIVELKGKSVAVYTGYWPQYAVLALTAAQVGLDPNKDIAWIESSQPMALFLDGKTDAFLSAFPFSQELRARRFGHVLFSTAEDHPWSQYFCCMLGGNRDYVRKYPIATKRVIRAILKAADLAPMSQRSSRGGSSMRALQAGTITPWRHCRRSTMTGGGITTRRIPYAIMRCGCAMSVSSHPRRRRSSPSGRIGASSRSSSAS